MITTSCLRLRSGGSPIRAGPPEDPLRRGRAAPLEGDFELLCAAPSPRRNHQLCVSLSSRPGGTIRVNPGKRRADSTNVCTRSDIRVTDGAVAGVGV